MGLAAVQSHEEEGRPHRREALEWDVNTTRRGGYQVPRPARDQSLVRPVFP
jgi:hypothetical protein